jgi:hypothetical protein
MVTSGRNRSVLLRLRVWRVDNLFWSWVLVVCEKRGCPGPFPLKTVGEHQIGLHWWGVLVLQNSGRFLSLYNFWALLVLLGGPPLLLLEFGVHLRW